ncbi:receptor kinase FERONIA [Olea europaea subsp. europaea]|uniref:Receptor kinase FERONIA n=1 Tax=Olea europaea subsp. europaea TaxID=158383 RepID=A0A8S0PWG0_OLEEU|nr:receptor kinase FERONIA [Olea europaea subsp. europaea]
MPFFPLLLSFLLHIITTALSTTPPYNAIDQIFINCGSDDSNTPIYSNLFWESDTSEPEEQGPSVPNSAPYRTARIFQSQFSYPVPIETGPKFLRLYFYAATYSNLNKSVFFNKNESSFTVTANDFTLLSNFSPYLTSTPSKPTFNKEFIITVQDDQDGLNITFSPSPKSYAFINGIEIVSMPDNLYFADEYVRIKFLNQPHDLKNTTAMETLYRLNVGGAYVGIKEDTGLFREWYQDDKYIFDGDFGNTTHAADVSIKYTERTPAYTAPEIVYTTSRVIANGSKSLAWSFPIDSGFYYLRFHFCEIQQENTNQNETVFKISIGNQTAEIGADVIYLTSDPEIPYFRDYGTWVGDDGCRGEKYLNISLFPSLTHLPKYSNSLLNGLEIFKLHVSNRSLAAADPEPIPLALDNKPPKKNSKESTLLYSVIGSVTGVLVVLLFISFLIFQLRRRVKDSSSNATMSSWIPPSSTSKSTSKTSGSGSSLPSDLCRHFLLEEIKFVTDNFNDSFVIGRGGFGNVYKGYIDNGATAVAIKRLNPSSNQGAREFKTEIQILSTLRHLHLVSLIGYCDENCEMILVYDYMLNGTLRDHLCKTENSPLQWKNRLQILIGAARGLDYLHTGTKHVIIHRDVKSTNILLDEKWVAKVSDFGLSKIGPTAGTTSHVSTEVKGSFGCLDPEYYKSQQLTHKSDIYSFGVVLFEVLCARPPIFPDTSNIQVNLAEWAKISCKKETLEQIVDPNLQGQIAPECLSKYAEIAIRCLGDNRTERPSMSDVVWRLEYVMQLQEATENRKNDLPMFPLYPLFLEGQPPVTNEIFSGSEDVTSVRC